MATITMEGIVHYAIIRVKGVLFVILPSVWDAKEDTISPMIPASVVIC